MVDSAESAGVVRTERPSRIGVELSERQRLVLRAVASAYLVDAAPVGSTKLAHSLSVRLSPASIRSTMAELCELGLLETPHTSAGRVPTTAGLRFFVDQLLYRLLLQVANRIIALHLV